MRPLLLLFDLLLQPYMCLKMFEHDLVVRGWVRKIEAGKRVNLSWYGDSFRHGSDGLENETSPIERLLAFFFIKIIPAISFCFGACLIWLRQSINLFKVVCVSWLPTRSKRLVCNSRKNFNSAIVVKEAIMAVVINRPSACTAVDNCGMLIVLSLMVEACTSDIRLDVLIKVERQVDAFFFEIALE